MKKILSLLIVMAAGVLSLNAQEQGRLTISAGQLKNITFGDNIKAVLVTPGSSDNEVKADMSAFQKLNISVLNGSLHINAGKDMAAGETVYVIVDDLQSLTLGQHTQVTTEGILYSKEIKVYVCDGSIAKLRTTGEVNAYSLDDLEYSIKKTSIRFHASAKNALGY